MCQNTNDSIFCKIPYDKLIDWQENFDKIHVKFLDLSNTHKNVSGFWKDFTNIDILLASNNKIDKICDNDFSQQESLRQIDLEKNKISEIQKFGFRGAENLENVNLAYNVISSIDSGTFRKNSYLTIIKLNNNQIENLPNDLFSTNAHLSEIHLQNGP